MRAFRSIAAWLSGNGRYALDAPVAALAGLSVAFLAFAAPPELLSNLIASTGLASILPEAQPPVGFKARIGLGAAGAVLVFTASFLLLRWLDRLGGTRRPAEAVPAEEGDVPRLRRRDVHPDAPPRPPIMAARELGEPAPPRAPARPAEPAVTDEDVAEPESRPPPVAHRPPEDRPLPPVPPREPEETRAEPVEAPRPRGASGPAEADKVLPDLSPQAGSLSELMARLEQGLARRQAPPPPASPSPARSAPPAPRPLSADDRLQSAIDNLQRLASRQG